MTTINSVDELHTAIEENMEYGLVFLVEDFLMQIVNIYMSDEEDLWGIYPYPSEGGDAMKVRAEDLAYPLEVLYTDKDRLA